MTSDGGFVNSDKIQDFVENVLDKTFENWILVARDDDHKFFKETNNGELLEGIVLYNVKAEEKEKSIKTAKEGHVATMLLDVVDSVCDHNEDEVVHFLSALSDTAQVFYGGDSASSMPEKERLKIKILSGFLNTAIESFTTTEGKINFIRTCLGSVIPARILAEGSEQAKEEMRSSMRAVTAGSGDGDMAHGAVGSVLAVVDVVLEAIDDGKTTDEILELMEGFSNSLSNGKK